MKRKVLIAALLVGLSVNLPVQAKSIALDDLQSFSIDNVKSSDKGKAFDANHWAYRTLKNVTDKYGVLIGKPGEKFDGTKPISRNEAAIILVNLMGKVEEENIRINEGDRAKIEILQQELGGEINRLSGRIGVIENSVAELKGSVSNIEESSNKTWKNAFGEDFKITGALQATYTAIPNKGADGYSPNFGLPYSELAISGKVHDHLNYMAQLVPTRNFNDLKSNGLLNDAYVSTDIIPKHKVYLGQVAIPVGIEAQNTPINVNFNDYSQASRKLLSNSLSTYYSYNHDVGAMIKGDWAPISYSVGTFNGTSLNSFDTNRRQSIAGQISVRPLLKYPTLGSLEIGSSTFHGSGLTSDLSQKYVQNIMAFHCDYKYKKFNLMGEYMQKNGFINPGQKARAWNIDAKYSLTDKINLLARYDNFNPNLTPSLNDLAAGINKSIEYVAGATYALKDNILLEINVTSVDNKFGKDSQRIGFLTDFLF